MTKRGPIVSRSSWQIVLLGAVLFAVFPRTDVQPWDEALYAVRARACVERGAWLDQTGDAVGGLYSSSHPPLGVWMIAASYAVFGVHAWSARLPAVLAGYAVIVVLGLFLRRPSATPAERTAAPYAMVLLLASMHFLRYARSAQLDVFNVLFTVVAMAAVVRWLEQGRMRDVVIAGVAIGAAFLSKLLVTGVAVAAWSLAVLMTQRRTRIHGIALAVAIGGAVAAPWFVMMSLRHPEYLAHVASAVGIVAGGGYSAASDRAWWYYLNQALVALPLLPLAALLARRENRLPLARFATVWLVIALAGFSLAAMKMPHFVMHALVPGAMLSALGLEALTRARRVWGWIAASAAIVAWSLDERIRMSVKALSLRPDAVVPLAAVAVIGLSLAAAVMYASRHPGNLRRRTAAINVLLALWMGLAVILHVRELDAGAEHGIGEIVGALSASGIRDLVVLHPDAPHDAYVPQLALYLDGWTLGWRAGYRAVIAPWQDAPHAADTMRMNGFVPETTGLLVVHPSDPLYVPPADEAASRRMVDAAVAGIWTPVAASPDYSLYVLRGSPCRAERSRDTSTAAGGARPCATRPACAFRRFNGRRG